MERTLILLKPDTVSRGLTGEIISRFESSGLKLVAAKMVAASPETANQHYPLERREFIEGMAVKTLESYKEQGLDAIADFGTEDPYKIGLEIQKWLVDFLTSGPLMAVVFEGKSAIAQARKIAGHTIPVKADPGTIRADFSSDSAAKANTEKRAIQNLVHASGDKAEAEFEIKLWFSEDELHDYDRV